MEQKYRLATFLFSVAYLFSKCASENPAVNNKEASIDDNFSNSLNLVPGKTYVVAPNGSLVLVDSNPKKDEKDKSKVTYLQVPFTVTYIENYGNSSGKEVGGIPGEVFNVTAHMNAGDVTVRNTTVWFEMEIGENKNGAYVIPKVLDNIATTKPLIIDNHHHPYPWEPPSYGGMGGGIVINQCFCGGGGGGGGCGGGGGGGGGYKAILKTA